MAGGSDPVITKKPEGAWTHAVWDTAFAKQVRLRCSPRQVPDSPSSRKGRGGSYRVLTLQVCRSHGLDGLAAASP
jgi:hypothetical protein